MNDRNVDQWNAGGGLGEIESVENRTGFVAETAVTKTGLQFGLKGSTCGNRGSSRQLLGGTTTTSEFKLQDDCGSFDF
jgi:hypothetical protein